MALELETSPRGDTCLIIARGEVDLYTSPDLRTAITKAIPRYPGAVGIDLSEVLYMDSSGVATLVEGLRMSGKDGGFVLVAPSESVMKVLQLSRLDSVFDVRDAWPG